MRWSSPHRCCWVSLVAVLGALTSWGHSAYAETAVYLGVPLLGVAAEANHRSGSSGRFSASSWI